MSDYGVRSWLEHQLLLKIKGQLRLPPIVTVDHFLIGKEVETQIDNYVERGLFFLVFPLAAFSSSLSGTSGYSLAPHLSHLGWSARFRASHCGHLVDPVMALRTAFNLSGSSL